MSDPYRVLGVSRTASEEEITQAYRKLAKRYHPDLNPGDKSAEEKMRQINIAYDQIKNPTPAGTHYEPGGPTHRPPNPPPGDEREPFGGFGAGGFDFGDMFGSAWQQGQRDDNTPPSLRAVENYIRTRQYRQAIHMLGRIESRDAEWYYYGALAHAGAGNRVTALNQARTAARMEPDNPLYQQLVEEFEQGAYAYRRTGTGYGFNMQRAGRTMLQLLLAQMCCFFCCRPC